MILIFSDCAQILMIAPRKLKNAPIKEAVIDFRVALKEEIEIEKLDSEYSSISNEYPKKETLLQGKLGLPFGESEPVSKIVNPIGYRYTSSDGKHSQSVAGEKRR